MLSHFLRICFKTILGGVIFMLIHLENVSKTFKVAERGSTFKDAIKSFIHPHYKLVHALKNVSFDIDEGEIVRLHWSKSEQENLQQSK